MGILKSRDQKRNVKEFYDLIGWHLNNDVYEDTILYEDLRLVSRDYIHNCHLRIKEHIKQRGKYFLDVASGPVQYPEYVEYSQGYNQRVCVDISISALIEARKKLGDKGCYILADITYLPFKNDIFDAVISLHTIYHVPKDEQKNAFKELHRVAKSGISIVIVYHWGKYSILMFFPSLLWRTGNILKRLLNISTNAEPKIYFCPHHFIWIMKEFSNTFNYKILTWRSVNTYFLKTFIHNRLYGHEILGIIFSIENKMPYVTGILGQYPLIIIRK